MCTSDVTDGKCIRRQRDIEAILRLLRRTDLTENRRSSLGYQLRRLQGEQLRDWIAASERPFNATPERLPQHEGATSEEQEV